MAANIDANVIQEYLERLRASRLYQAKDKILCAISGGKDSMALATLLKQTNQPFALAHCNFSLRDEESDADEQMLLEIADQWQVQIKTRRFDTQAYALENKLSIQVAARNLRYAFLEQARAELDCTFIATAHHQQDVAETILYNLIKGTGLAGLKGIPEKNGKIIRPLLHFSRKQIEDYISEHNIPYREDSSNQSNKYSRNKIRNQVLPVLQTINPALLSTMQENARRFSEIEQIYQTGVVFYKKKLLKSTIGGYKISIAHLKQIDPVPALLFELLKPFNFHADQCEQILIALDAQPGKQFLSPTHQLIRDRQFLLISKLEDEAADHFLLQQEDRTLKTDHGSFSLSFHGPDYKIKKQPSIAALDADRIQWPILLRSWKKGDYFYPFGMKMKKKKVNEVFKDLKIPVHEKHKHWILLDQSGKILWLAGLRIDERFRIRENTNKVLEISWKAN